MLPMLSSCCCGLSLKMGSFLLGAFCALYAAVLLVASATLASDPSKIVPQDLLGGSEQDAVYTVRAVFAILALCNFFKMLTSYFLMYGAIHDSPVLLLPWLLGYAVVVPLYAMLMTPCSIALLVLGMWDYGSFVLVSTLTSIGVSLYFMLVVYSLYRQLTGERHVRLQTAAPPSRSSSPRARELLDPVAPGEDQARAKHVSFSKHLSPLRLQDAA